MKLIDFGLPDHWIARDDYQPGSALWWGEWAIFKLTGYCDHTGVSGSWVRGSKSCERAWECEYQAVIGGVLNEM